MKRIAQITGQDVSDIGDKLCPNRLIEAVILSDALHNLFRGAAISNQNIHGVARRELDEKEVQHDHSQKQRNSADKPCCNAAFHGHILLIPNGLLRGVRVPPHAVHRPVKPPATDRHVLQVHVADHLRRRLGYPGNRHGLPDAFTDLTVEILALGVIRLDRRSLEALRHPETLKYTGTHLSWLPTNHIRDKQFMLANRNALVSKEKYPGCDGLKTGYHSKGGYSLVATAKQGDERVISVVLGVADRNSRNATTRKLLDKGFAEIRKQ